MAYLDLDAPSGRSELTRWGACGAAVLLAHGLIVLAILPRSDEADTDPGSPVVMIDLAPVAAAPPAPPNELAPGPVEPPQVEQRTADQHTQKPPVPDDIAAQNPVVSLPPPEPKPTEQPTQEKAQQTILQDTIVPTAPPSANEPAPRPAAPAPGRNVNSQAIALATWQRVLAAHYERFKRFPPGAHGSGVADLEFTLDRQGRVVSSRLVRSSGSARFDEEALAMIKRAEPFPHPTTDIADRDLLIRVSIRYH